jgi:hypothetical protein
MPHVPTKENPGGNEATGILVKLAGNQLYLFAQTIETIALAGARRQE